MRDLIGGQGGQAGNRGMARVVACFPLGSATDSVNFSTS